RRNGGGARRAGLQHRGVFHAGVPARWGADPRCAADRCVRDRLRAGPGGSRLMDIGLIAAFLGGVLALLSPCGALLLPAFFASSVGGGLRLGLHALVFYVGLVLVLVPLGLGVGALGSLFVTYRTTIVVVAS